MLSRRLSPVLSTSLKGGCGCLHSTQARFKSSKYTVHVHPLDPSASLESPPGIAKRKLWASTQVSSKSSPAGKNRIFYGENEATILTSLGDAFGQKAGNVRRETVRKAVGSAVKEVRDLGADELSVVVDASLDPQASAVAAHLALYKFSLKTDPPSPYAPSADRASLDKISIVPSEVSAEWDSGVIYAEAQNLARTLMELPGNMMTPAIFAERMQAEFANIPKVTVTVHDEAWAREKGMFTFLSVAKGTSEPAKFVKIHYRGAEETDRPLALVGKGVTFDSGGISIKPSANMKLMRGDMGGAAAVAAATWAIAKLKLPLNVVTTIPLTENMPGPAANKPGDIVYAINGKSVEIDNTDAEGRLILADALYYTSKVYKPHSIVDVATLTGAVDVALGGVFTGAYTNSDDLWHELHRAGEIEYDRLWRLPLDDGYAHQISSSNADLCNTGGRSAGSCTAALFLKSFVYGVEKEEGHDSPAIRWAHLDIAGAMQSSQSMAYQAKGMTGRPVRTLVEWAKNLAQRT